MTNIYIILKIRLEVRENVTQTEVFIARKIHIQKIIV